MSPRPADAIQPAAVAKLLDEWVLKSHSRLHVRARSPAYAQTSEVTCFVVCSVVVSCVAGFLRVMVDLTEWEPRTRRGVGASDHPAAGYDPERGADDILEVIDAVGMEKPIERAALNQAYAGRRAILSRWQRDLLAGVPTARVVELFGATLCMFLSNEADVLREVRAFAATLQQ